MRYPFLLSVIAILVAAAASAQAQTATARARDLGIPFDGETGQFNAITDVLAEGMWMEGGNADL
jgi:hypothetical protein